MRKTWTWVKLDFLYETSTWGNLGMMHPNEYWWLGGQNRSHEDEEVNRSWIKISGWLWPNVGKKVNNWPTSTLGQQCVFCVELDFKLFVMTLKVFGNENSPLNLIVLYFKNESYSLQKWTLNICTCTWICIWMTYWIWTLNLNLYKSAMSWINQAQAI